MSRECSYCNDLIENLPFNCRYCKKIYCSKHRIPKNHDCVAIEEKSLQEFQTEFNSSEAPIIAKQEKVLYSQTVQTNRPKIERPSLLLIPLIIAFFIVPAMGTFSSSLYLVFTDNIQTLEDFYFYNELIHFLTQILCVVLLILISKICFNQSLRKGYLLDRSSLKVGIQVFLALVFFTGFVIDSVFPTSEIPRPLSTKELIFGLCATLIGAPLMEELLFRKLLIPALKQRGTGDLIAVVFSALTFALVHVPGDIQGDLGNFDLSLIFSRFVGGFFLSFSFIKTKKVVTPMLIHFLWNFYITLNQYTVTYSEISILETINFIFILITNVSALVYGVYIIIRNFSHKDSIWSLMAWDKASPRVGQSAIIIGGMFTITLTLLEVLKNKITSSKNGLEATKTRLVLNVSVLGVLLILGIIINHFIKFRQKQRNFS